MILVVAFADPWRSFSW